MNTRIRVELVDVKCRNTEDVTGADHFYILGAATLVISGTTKAILTKPIRINDGETKPFPASERVLFDAVVPEAELLGIYMQAFDEDAGKEWHKIAPMVQEAIDAWVVPIQVPVPGGAPGLDPISSAFRGHLAKRLGPLVKSVIGTLVRLDKDDLLGTVEVFVPRAGAAVETGNWTMKKGGMTGWSTWNYTVRYRIVRTSVA